MMAAWGDGDVEGVEGVVAEEEGGGKVSLTPGLMSLQG